jgi:hypothetical protein
VVVILRGLETRLSHQMISESDLFLIILIIVVDFDEIVFGKCSHKLISGDFQWDLIESE